MCRNIRTLHNFEPPASEEEIQAAALQFVRKVSGYNKPPQDNIGVFEQAVMEISAITSTLLQTMVATSAPKNREIEAEKKRKKWREREARASRG